jgi:hypothetical protein
MVDSVRSMSPDEVLEHFVATTDALSDAARSIGRDEWKAIGEAPPGHVTLHEVVLHALWDSWIHERDVVVPLGLEQPVEPDEVIACLRYAAALAPAFSASTGSTREGRLGVETTDPDSAFVVEAGSEVVVRDVQIPAGTPTITGDAVALVGALSIREPLQHELSDADEWMVLGLATVFDQA